MGARPERGGRLKVSQGNPRALQIPFVQRWISTLGGAYLFRPMPASDPDCPSEGAPQAQAPKQRPRVRGTTRSQRALPIAIASAGLFVRYVDVRAPDVVYVKGILEASEGLGVVFAERGGELVIASPPDRAAALDELLADLVIEIGARIDADTRIRE